MNVLKKIIKNTLLELQVQDVLATPDNYYKEFLRQSKIDNIKIPECKLFNEIIKNNNTKNLLLELDNILAPSLHHGVETQITKLSNDLLQNPQKLFEKETLAHILTITDTRISNDKKILKDKSSDLKQISDLMSKYFAKIILESGNSTTSIASIKNDLENLTISENSKRDIGRLQGQLVATIHNIEINMEKNQEMLLENQSQFSRFEKKISALEQELEKSKVENELDYLTKVLNRRAFNNESLKIEKKYKLFQKNYAIIFYDLDHFKNINDTYGHSCGDAVLRTFAGVLSNLSRDEDVVTRYGGEEFVILLNYEKNDDLILYLKRVKALVQKREFNYKEYKNIDVTFSAGLAMRNKYDSLEETLIKADKLLYQAKEHGRDKIILDNETTL